MKIVELTEAFTNPYPLKGWTDMSYQDGAKSRLGMQSTFVDDYNDKYKIEAMRMAKTKQQKDTWRASAGRPGIRIPSRRGGIWELSLSKIKFNDDYSDTIDSDELTGEGDAFRVFATVFEFLKLLKKQFAPEFISIKSKDTASRAKLYQKMAQRYAPQFGYEISKVVQSGDNQRINLKLKES